jgi:sulfur carrier protein
MINTIINGLPREFSDGITLYEAIISLQIEDKVMACAVNMNIVKKEDWSSYILCDNDKIELLQFVGGG